MCVCVCVCAFACVCVCVRKATAQSVLERAYGAGEKSGREKKSEHNKVHTLFLFSAMADDRSWMFCPTTGALLELDAERNVAWCPVSGHEQDLDGMRRGIDVGRRLS